MNTDLGRDLALRIEERDAEVNTDAELAELVIPDLLALLGGALGGGPGGIRRVFAILDRERGAAERAEVGDVAQVRA